MIVNVVLDIMAIGGGLIALVFFIGWLVWVLESFGGEISFFFGVLCLLALLYKVTQYFF